MDGSSQPNGGQNKQVPYHDAQIITQNNSETILLCNRCARNWNISSQRLLVPESHKNDSSQRAVCKRCPVQLGNSFPNNKDSCNHLVSIVILTFEQNLPFWYHAFSYHCCVLTFGQMFHENYRSRLFWEWDATKPFSLNKISFNEKGQAFSE